MQRRLRSVSRNVRTKGLIVLVVVVALACARDRSTTSAGEVVSVCQVLADLSFYRGKVVRVRGVFTYDGLREDDCEKEFVTGGHKWPPILNLATTKYRGPEEPPFGFATDSQSWDDMERVAIETGKQGRPVEIWVTIIGQLRAQPEYVLPGNRVRGGYGHLGALPAEIVVKRVTDVLVKPVAQSRYDYRLKKAQPR